MTKMTKELQPGDLVDLQGDSVLGHHPEFQFELAEVVEIERETDDCYVVYFDNHAAGYAPDHVFKVGD
jgi:hypothetical protein